jgi:hypothetical protein
MPTQTIDEVYQKLQQKQMSAEDFKEWLKTVPPEKIQPYSGSKR